MPSLEMDLKGSVIIKSSFSFDGYSRLCPEPSDAAPSLAVGTLQSPQSVGAPSPGTTAFS